MLSEQTIKKGAFFVVGIFIQMMLACNEPALAQGVDLAAAKKEGALVFYGASRATDMNEQVQVFMKKYPFVDAKYFRAGGTPLLQKILTEAKGGQHGWDVVSALGPQIILLKEKGLLAPYKSPHQKFFPKGFYDPQGYWTDTYDLFVTIAYNTQIVPKDKVPKTWEDLLDPMWKDGKIILDVRRHDWFFAMKEFMGQDKGERYMKRFRLQKPAFRQGNSLITQLMAAGEFSIAITYAEGVQLMKEKGAPVDWVAVDPMITLTEPIAQSKNAKNPNVAKLFIDFLLSKEGAELLASEGRVPARKGVKPKVERLNPENFNLYPVNVSSEKLNPREYREFFGIS
ncbi:MAG: extracellular solute-binding protein [Candidatus Binatia bacterium]